MSNKSEREKLEKIYGHRCMLHEGLKIKGYKHTKGKYTKKIGQQLTYHHIKPLRNGGKTTLENGAVLCRGCHDYLEQQPKPKRDELNKKLINYKLSFAELTTKSVEKVGQEEIEYDDDDYVIIKAYNNKQRRQQEKRELREMIGEIGEIEEGER